MKSTQAAQVGALESLGLKPLEALILLTVMRGGEVTSASLKAASGASTQSVAAAVDALVRRRILDRLSERRPQLVFLHAQASESIQQLVTEGREAQRHRASQVERCVAELEVAARRRAERGRPRSPALDERPTARGRTSHDEVIAAGDLGAGVASRSLVGCPARVLVTDTRGLWDPSGRQLEQLAGQQQPGSEVRLSEEPLPRLRVLDRDRATVLGSSAYGLAMVWSWDQRQVRAALELFELWWARAEAGPVKPYPPKQPEPEWDVEEWDPDDLWRARGRRARSRWS